MSFNAEEFMNMSTRSSMDTTRPRIGDGEFLAYVKDLQITEPRKAESAAKGVNFVIEWKIEDEAVKSRLGRENVSLRQYVYVELAEGGGFATGEGKNTMLGQIREALGQNDPDQDWAPNNMIGGGPVLLMVGSRPNPNNDEEQFDDVKRVVSAS